MHDFVHETSHYKSLQNMTQLLQGTKIYMYTTLMVYADVGTFYLKTNNNNNINRGRG